MISTNDFPYPKYFFDNERLIHNLLQSIFPNGVPLEKELAKSEIESYNGYLEVQFISDLRESFNTKIRNNDSFFKFLLKKIDTVNKYYSEQSKISTSEIEQFLFESLIAENCNKISYVLSDYFDLVGYIDKHKSQIKDLISKYSDDIIWEGMFTQPTYYLKFKNYQNFIIDYYADFSYLFQRMKVEEIILKHIKHIDFMEWLKENKFISEKVFDDFSEKGYFRSLSKSTSAQRENNFNKTFDF